MTDTRTLQSEYMHWAKTRSPVRFNLASSEVEHFRLDLFPIDIGELELDGASYHRYPPLRQAMAAKEGVASDRVVMANGASMANYLALAALVTPGDEVLVERPTYEPLLATIRFCGAEVKRFERRAEDGFRLDPDAVARALTPKTKLIVLTNLHNPTSAWADEATLRRIADLGTRVLIDEIYLDAVPGARSAVHLGDLFVTTSSLTKVYGLSGLRCGWILAEPELAERMWRLNELFGVSQPHADERLSILALERLDQIFAATPALLTRNRAIAERILGGRPELDHIPQPHGLTLFPRLRRGSVDDLDRLLRERYDASIVPGRWFEAPGHFRLGIGGPSEIVEGGLNRLCAALDELA